MNRNIYRIIVSAFILSLQIGCSDTYYSDWDLKTWRKDPWGCNGMRKKVTCDRILSKADNMNEEQKIQLLYRLGKPDTLVKRREWVVHIYYFGSNCNGNYNDISKKDGRLEVFQDSAKSKTIFGVEYF